MTVSFYRRGGALILLLAANLLLSTAAHAMLEHGFLYFPIRELAATPADVRLPYEDVSFPAADGVRLHGWFVPGEPGRPVILFCHGNAGNISHRIRNLSLFREHLGVSVFIFDYRGYGQSEGKATEEGTYDDARGALAWLKQRGWTPEKTIYFGRSLGAAVATQLALEAPPAGLVMESPFPSVPAMGRHHYSILYALLGWTLTARYDTEAKIGQLRVPLLVTQGSRDTIVPEHMARRVFEKANEPKTFHLIRGAGHNDTLEHDEAAYWSAWRRFLDGLK